VLVRFGDPPRGYLTGRAVGKLEDLVEEWADPEVRAVVIAGSVPGCFITHFSVAEILAGQATMAAKGPELNYRVHAIYGALSALAKPVICAMNGDTMGAGFELARLVGRAAALELVMTAAVLTPEEAYERGIVNRLAGDATATAMDLARRLAELPQVALGAAKRIIHQAADLPLNTALRMEADASFRAKVSPESTAAMERYLAIPEADRRTYLDGRTRRRRAPLDMVPL
jgi:enoyl-CoA hydratase